MALITQFSRGTYFFVDIAVSYSVDGIYEAV